MNRVDEEAIISQAERLLPEIAKRLHASVANHPVAQGRTLPQIKVMAHLYHHDLSTVGEIATGIGSSMPATSETIDRLVDEGLVERGANPADRRQVILTLTPRARALGDEIHALRRAQLRAALDLLAPEERPYFVRSLQALVEALRQQPRELGNREQGIGNSGCGVALEQAPATGAVVTVSGSSEGKR